MSLDRNEVRAGMLALAVHAAFFLFLVFGVSWQAEHAAPVMAELWPALPEAAPAPREPRAAPRPKPAEKKPLPKEEPAPVKKPDIALEKKQRELQRKKDEQAEREALQREAEQLKKQREARRKIEEEELQRRMMDEEVASETRRVKQMAAQAAASRRSSAAAKVIGEYRDKISAKVRGNTRLLENLEGNPQAKFRVRMLPTGEVLAVTIVQRSGNPAFDQAVERAIFLSSPLPLPDDPQARAEFIPEVTLAHRARE